MESAADLVRAHGPKQAWLEARRRERWSEDLDERRLWSRVQKAILRQKEFWH